MKWFKRLLPEKSANHCSLSVDRSSAVARMNTKRCIKASSDCGSCSSATQTVAVNGSGSVEALLSRCDALLKPSPHKGSGPGYRRSRRTTSRGEIVQRSASRLLAELDRQEGERSNISVSSNVLRIQPSRETSVLVQCRVSTTTAVVDPDDFFDDPDEVRKYRAEKQWMSEWCIIDERNKLDFGSDEEDEDPNGLYETTAFCGSPDIDEDLDFDDDVNEESYVNVQRTPSVISLSTYTEDKFGIFYGSSYTRRAMPKIPEATYYSFSYDIQSGLAMDPAISAFEEIMVDTFNLDTNSDPPISPLIKNAISTSSIICNTHHLQEVKKSYSDENLKKETHKTPSPMPIARLFGLSDEGSICMNMDHIREERGYGFLMRRNKRLYRHVELGQIIDERHLLSSSIFCAVLRRIWQLLAFARTHQQSDHPRNKPPSIGSGHDSSAGSSIGDYAHALANDPKSTFSRNIQNFITCTKESRELAPQVVMRNMRQFMSGMKNYLVKHGEGDFQNEVLRARSRLKPDEFLNLDQILETVMHRLVVLPLKDHLYTLFVEHYMQSGQIQLLVDNVKFGSLRSPQDFGIPATVSPPSPAAMQHISLLLLRLQEAELPLDKLAYLLAVVSAIFETATHSQEQALGADYFLPLLVYVVAKCEFIGAEIEAEFMYCLLQQSLLTGEAGYYLTSLCSAVQVLKGLIGDVASATNGNKVEPLDNRANTLPACSSVLRVIIPDECNGSLQTRTLPVRPNTTTKEVCRTIAHKARITNPQDYALFELVDGEETLLTDSECPQESRLAARGKHCMFAYKRIDAKIAWPTLSNFH